MIKTCSLEVEGVIGTRRVGKIARIEGAWDMEASMGGGARVQVCVANQTYLPFVSRRPRMRPGYDGESATH